MFDDVSIWVSFKKMLWQSSHLWITLDYCLARPLIIEYTGRELNKSIWLYDLFQVIKNLPPENGQVCNRVASAFAAISQLQSFSLDFKTSKIKNQKFNFIFQFFFCFCAFVLLCFCTSCFCAFRVVAVETWDTNESRGPNANSA